MFANYALMMAQSTEDGLTASEMLDALPTDPASVFTITLVAFVVALVLWTGRPKKKGGGAS